MKKTRQRVATRAHRSKIDENFGLDLTNRKHTGMRPDGSADFACPDCGRVETLSPKTPVRASTPVRISYRCQCGVMHAVFLYTRAARVEVDALGTLIVRHSDIKIPARIRNVSRSGLLLEFDDEAAIRMGDDLVVKFSLGEQGEVFLKAIEIRRISTNLIGAEFTRNKRQPLDRKFETALTQIVVGSR